MTQTCQKPSLFDASIKTWTDEQCPWTADGESWSFTPTSVTGVVKRTLKIFKEIDADEDKFTLQGGYSVSSGSNNVSLTSNSSDVESDISF